MTRPLELICHGRLDVYPPRGSYQLVVDEAAGRVPVLTTVTVIASFASLGLPGLAGFVAEFQIFTGTFAVYPVLAAIGLLGVLVTAALFLQLLQRVFLGDLTTRWTDLADLSAREAVPLGALLALTVVIGVAPRWLCREIGRRGIGQDRLLYASDEPWGDHVGELALISPAPRNATVVADTEALRGG